jgi:hypothetical protein
VPSTRKPQLGKGPGSTATAGHVEIDWQRSTCPVGSAAQFAPMTMAGALAPLDAIVPLAAPASDPVLTLKHPLQKPPRADRAQNDESDANEAAVRAMA